MASVLLRRAAAINPEQAVTYSHARHHLEAARGVCSGIVGGGIVDLTVRRCSVDVFTR